MEFNIIASVGTTEIDLAPYPGGSATVPSGKNRKIYVIVLSNLASATNTLTLKIYKGETLETSLPISVGGTVEIISEKIPAIIIPSGRTLKAIASEESVTVLMTAKDE